VIINNCFSIIIKIIMKSEKFTKKSIRYYFMGFLLILIGVILIYINYNTLYYSIIGIGALFLIFGLNETIKSI
jgi:uncharacterized membrane protein HdeD (DUF308 family)